MAAPCPDMSDKTTDYSFTQTRRNECTIEILMISQAQSIVISRAFQPYQSNQPIEKPTESPQINHNLGYNERGNDISTEANLLQMST